jgi:hypothetical protein
MPDAKHKQFAEKDNRYSALARDFSDDCLQYTTGSKNTTGTERKARLTSAPSCGSKKRLNTELGAVATRSEHSTMSFGLSISDIVDS